MYKYLARILTFMTQSGPIVEVSSYWKIKQISTTSI